MSHPLEPIRDYYLVCYRQSAAKARAELQQVVTELLLEMPSKKDLEFCYRLSRVDIIGKLDGESIIRELNVDPREVSVSQSALPTGVSIDFPLVWNGIEFEVTGLPPDKPALQDWSSRWLDISDDRYDEAAEFQAVVHSVSPPSEVAGGFCLCVDFGSAPTAAFDELVQILVENGRRVVVGSFFLGGTERP